MRLRSLDILKALTLFPMIWAHDFWTWKGGPNGLRHAQLHADFLGFSSIVFPSNAALVLPFAFLGRGGMGGFRVPNANPGIVGSLPLFFVVNHKTAHGPGTVLDQGPFPHGRYMPIGNRGFLLLLVLALNQGTPGPMGSLIFALLAMALSGLLKKRGVQLII